MERLISYLDLIRPKATLKLATIPLLGAVIGFYQRGDFSLFEFLRVALGALAAIGAGMGLNDWLDRDLDIKGGKTPYDRDGRISWAKPLLSANISSKGALFFIAALMLLAIGLTLTLPNPKSLYLLLIGGYTGCGMVGYCRLRRRLPLGGPIMASILGLFSSGGYLAVNEPNPKIIAILFGLVFLWELGPHNQGADLLDLENDLKKGIKTIPSTLGVSFSLSLMTVSCLGMIFFSSLLFWTAKMGIIYLAGSLSGGAMLMATILFISPANLMNSALREFKMAKRYLGILFVCTALDVLLKP